jgi:hypothetical protein
MWQRNEGGRDRLSKNDSPGGVAPSIHGAPSPILLHLVYLEERTEIAETCTLGKLELVGVHSSARQHPWTHQTF